MTAPTTPAVFIHGLWLHATSWQPWMELFAESGYDPIAPGWPGEADTVDKARKHPELVADLGIDEITDHYAEIIRALRQRDRIAYVYLMSRHLEFGLRFVDDEPAGQQPR